MMRVCLTDLFLPWRALDLVRRKSIYLEPRNTVNSAGGAESCDGTGTRSGAETTDGTHRCGTTSSSAVVLDIFARPRSIALRSSAPGSSPEQPLRGGAPRTSGGGRPWSCAPSHSSTVAIFRQPSILRNLIWPLATRLKREVAHERGCK